jgi:ribosomal protein S18 acetylase RimI-like enzyme
MSDYIIRPLTHADRDRVREFITLRWGAEIVVAHHVMYRPHELRGLIALRGDDLVGLVTLHNVGNACEIVTIDSTQPGAGIGTALIDATKTLARQAGCTRLWLITTNDNLNALRFYQKRGFVLVSVHRNAVIKSRQLKPEIPLTGNDGIPLRDEIELEMLLESAA